MRLRHTRSVADLSMQKTKLPERGDWLVLLKRPRNRLYELHYPNKLQINPPEEEPPEEVFLEEKFP